MKKEMKFTYKGLVILGLILVFQVGAFAKEHKSKTIKKTLDAKTNIEVLHKYGALEIETSHDNKVHFEATITFDAAKENDVQVIFDHFDIAVSSTGNNLVLETIFDVKNWNQILGAIKIKFKDGEKAKNINDLKIKMLVKVPAVDYLKLTNKYDKITIKHSLQANIAVTLYEGVLETKDINGDLDLALKYSKANIGNYANANIELYETTLHLGNGKNVNINAKYSKFFMGSTNKFVVDAYEGKGEIGLIKDNLILKSKYFKFAVDKFEKADIDMYEGAFMAKKGKELTGKSKYTPLSINNIDKLSFESTYETDVEIGYLGSLKTLDSKYSNFTIESLSGKIKAKTYEGQIKVQQMEGSFEGVDLEGKYTSFLLPLPQGLKYRLVADLRYVAINYDQARFDTSVYVEKNDKIDIQSKIHGATDNSPLIKITAYEGKVILE